MNAQRLLQHFHRIAEAPDAVPRLRRFILDLAVRGSWLSKTRMTNPRLELLKRIEQDVRDRRASSAISEPRNTIEIPIESPPIQRACLVEMGTPNQNRRRFLRLRV